jgi:hypothetical protein
VRGGLGRLAVVEGVLGQSRPGPHGEHHVGGGQRRQGGDEVGLVASEELDGAIGHVGHDGLELATRQGAVERRCRGHRQRSQAPGQAQRPGGIATGQAGVIP